ncbi:hemerythrin domain-containing protein [Streptomyces sp. NPDC001714]|uniref:hemerythrin domain-containing protein n=1 Tax=Streptomyces sp. NPDC001714 TaxID=3364603 RepID=UPI0036CEF0BB
MRNHHPGVTETSTAAWERRAALAGPVDFTMMYVAHDAFNRDLDRLLDAVADGRGHSPAVVATWQLFSKQLHTHHAAEDTVLWPRLRAAVADPDEQRILDDMEAEHASLDPRVEQINAAIADQNTKALERELSVLAKGLSAHMIHEESQALPLLERRLGQAGWDAFSKEIRDQQGGIKGAAEYLPWVLDGATEQLKTQVLRLLPAPARVVYRRVWVPKYRKAARL